MLIQSAIFLLYFCIVFCLTWLTPPSRRWIPLLAASLLFVAYGHPLHLLFLLLPTLAVYATARRMERLPADGPARRRWLRAALALTLGALLAAKYLNFLMETVAGAATLAGLRWSWRPLQLLMPIGISFYTFRLIGYLLDVYYRRIDPERHVGRFALFAAFFPQVSAGPIERAGRFLPLLKSPEAFDPERILGGATQMAWGFFKKLVVADRLGIFVDQVFAAPHGQGLNLVIGAWFYAIQIYGDFSGYTDIAIGLARMLGYESTVNFDRPYLSGSVAEFWSRWHISLSNWFRDYLFLPVSFAVMRPFKGERALGLKVETLGYAAASLLTMSLCGLWHGASWTFVVWGALHGIYLVVGQIGRKRRRRWSRRAGLLARPALHRAVRVVLTFNLVSFAWIFFRAPTLARAVEYINDMQLKPGRTNWGYLLVNLVLVLVLLAAEHLQVKGERLGWWKRIPAPLRAVLLALLVCLIILFSMDSGNEFIYIRF